MDRVLNVLFLCTGNSARSIMAEALLNYWGKGRFKAYSAGSEPRGLVDPLALEQLTATGVPVDGLTSKSWAAFAADDAPKMDFVITVCEESAVAACPAWPGAPVTANWGVPDPVPVTGSEVDRRLAFREAFRVLETRIKLFANLRLEALDRLATRRELDRIGETGA